MLLSPGDRVTLACVILRGRFAASKGDCDVLASLTATAIKAVGMFHSTSCLLQALRPSLARLTADLFTESESRFQRCKRDSPYRRLLGTDVVTIQPDHGGYAGS